MDYNNPLSPWNHGHHDDKMYDDMTDEEKMKVGCLHLFVVILMFFVGIGLCCLFGSCTTTKYVTVPEIHDQHHWHTDSIHQTDSIIKENTTTIMQLDSSAMAQYGIQLKGAERAWLVKTAELELQIQKLAKITQEKDSVRDSIPILVPTPIEVKVPAELSKWQSFRIVLGDIVLFLIAAVGGYFILKKIKS
jgi:hypothetical protein